MIYLSLCIPTNGMSEWVFPVLDAIYSQNADNSQYEVVVTNNGDNEEFHERMKERVTKYTNLKYKKTDAFLFENQIEALRLADGEFLKFLNHRSILEPGALDWMISRVKSLMKDKPIIYMSNGAKGNRQSHEYNTFDEFVCGLSHLASWTTGVGVWKRDFEMISADHIYNKISPHSDVLFAERNRNRYIIDDTLWSHDIDSSHKNKGKYDLYKAFAVEEISITLGLYNDGDISAVTLKKVIKAYKGFVAFCYREFSIRKKPCSYNLNGFDDAMGVFMSKSEILIRAYLGFLVAGVKRIIRFGENNETQD